MKLIYFSLIVTPLYFFKKVLRIITSCSSNHKITAGRCFIFFIQNIKAETTKKTPFTDAKSRLRCTELWLYSISLRKRTLKI